MAEVSSNSTQKEKTTFGKKVELKKIEVGDIGGKTSLAALRQALYIQSGNQRRATAKTKKRGEVRGGGRKPWRQKGTGRARAGSSRNPLWRGGGVAFGPTAEHHFYKRLPKKIKKIAFISALRLKSEKEKLFLVNQEIPSFEKTKEALFFLSCFPFIVVNVLIVVPKKEKEESWRNLTGVRLVSAELLGVKDILDVEEVIFSPKAWKIVKKKINAN